MNGTQFMFPLNSFDLNVINCLTRSITMVDWDGRVDRSGRRFSVCFVRGKV